MPCNHKFQRYLNLENIDFVPTTLIVGTFNPAWPVANTAQWFYGRVDNNFWEVLPRLYGQGSKRNSAIADWKRFCHDKKIAITDLISSIGDANPENENHIDILGGYGDDDIATNFFDFDLVNIVRLLRNHPTITNVYITRSISETFWKNKIYSIKNYCKSKNINLVPLLTPSGYAYFQQGKYNKQNPNEQLNLPDYILTRWREVWHPIIIEQ
jgi:hypothetical protein